MSFSEQDASIMHELLIYLRFAAALTHIFAPPLLRMTVFASFIAIAYARWLSGKDATVFNIMLAELLFLILAS